MSVSPTCVSTKQLELIESSQDQRTLGRDIVIWPCSSQVQGFGPCVRTTKMASGNSNHADAGRLVR